MIYSGHWPFCMLAFLALWIAKSIWSSGRRRVRRLVVEDKTARAAQGGPYRATDWAPSSQDEPQERSCCAGKGGSCKRCWARHAVQRAALEQEADKQQRRLGDARSVLLLPQMRCPRCGGSSKTAGRCDCPKVHGYVHVHARCTGGAIGGCDLTWIELAPENYPIKPDEAK